MSLGYDVSVRMGPLRCNVLIMVQDVGNPFIFTRSLVPPFERRHPDLPLFIESMVSGRLVHPKS